MVLQNDLLLFYFIFTSDLDYVCCGVSNDIIVVLVLSLECIYDSSSQKVPVQINTVARKYFTYPF